MLLTALMTYEAELDECGHPRSQSLAWEHDARNPDHVARYVAGAPWRCLACTEIARAQRAYAAQLGDTSASDMDGLKWAVTLTPRHSHG